jgi:hypothetical protein
MEALEVINMMKLQVYRKHQNWYLLGIQERVSINNDMTFTLSQNKTQNQNSVFLVILLHQIVILLLKITSYNAKHSKIEELD